MPLLVRRLGLSLPLEQRAASEMLYDQEPVHNLARIHFEHTPIQFSEVR
jgi:hypothetical protein